MGDLNSTQLRKGIVFEHEGKVYRVLDYKHVKKGRGLATIRVKVRDIEGGASVEKTFTSNEKVDSVALSYTSAQFLYSDSAKAYFMDTKDFSQFDVPIETVEELSKFLQDGSKVQVMWLEDRVVGLTIPKKMTFEVTQTGPGVAGDTVANATKEAEIETGYKLQVPLFIKNGDKIIINTENETYVSKA